MPATHSLSHVGFLCNVEGAQGTYIYIDKSVFHYRILKVKMTDFYHFIRSMCANGYNIFCLNCKTRRSLLHDDGPWILNSKIQILHG